MSTTTMNKTNAEKLHAILGELKHETNEENGNVMAAAILILRAHFAEAIQISNALDEREAE